MADTSRIAHLSDLHLGWDGGPQDVILDGLLNALASLRPLDAIAVTGDVFHTNRPSRPLLERAVRLITSMSQLVDGGAVWLLPGNHDRRDEGVFGPWNADAFQQLEAFLKPVPGVQVFGNRTPFLAQRVHAPGIPADVVAYDSSHTPKGLISAAGVARHLDVLAIATELGDRERPLLFLIHHHLVPTPPTGGSLTTSARPAWQRGLLGRVLPEVVGHQQRDEEAAPAAGAGTLLATLQSMGRAVVVLHGHPLAATRLLAGLNDESDVLLSSPGSAGTARTFHAGDAGAARQWPSLSVVELSQGQVDIRTQVFSPIESGRVGPVRHVVTAVRSGQRWLPTVPAHPSVPGPIMAVNAADVVLTKSKQFLDRYDLEVTRRLVATRAATLPQYLEAVEGPPGATAVDIVSGGVDQKDTPCPAWLEVPLTGEASWKVVGGAFATLAAASEVEPGAAYESVGLFCRAHAEVARLRVNLGPVPARPFASASDLTTGREWPVPLQREGPWAVVELKNCPARTRLRVYWPLV